MLGVFRSVIAPGVHQVAPQAGARAFDRVVAIDLLRVVAALGVMFFHLGYWTWAAPNNTGGSILRGAASYPELAPFAFWGRVGVEIFFVVSGLVIAASADHRTAWPFIRSRVLRLFPAVLACATITALVALTIQWKPDAELMERYLRSITFNMYGPYVDGVYWTLGVEWCFYAAVALVLATGRGHFVEPIIVVLGVISGLYATWEWASSISVLPPPALSHNNRDAMLFLAYTVYFAIGVEIWALRHGGGTWLRRVALGFLVTAGALGIYARSAESMKDVIDQALTVVPALVWLVAVVAGGIGLAMNGPIAMAVGRRWSAVIRLAALTTYPLYLLHQVVGSAVLRWLLVAGLDRFAALITTMVLMVLAALSITLTVEPQLRRLVAYVIDLPSRAISAATTRS